MNKLSFESFFTSSADAETIQYRILGGVKKARTDFGKHKIYPSLAQLKNLKDSIEKVIDERENLVDNFPKKIRAFDLKEKKVIYENTAEIKLDEMIEEIFELIEWALPLINEVAEEGMVLYNFVDKNIILEQVGVLPMYKDEGYFMVTDNSACQLQIHRYESTLYASSDNEYRRLKTRLVKNEKQVIIRKPAVTIKHELIKESKDLPNPATFLFDTELDFPFRETIFPVVKRKLISHIAS